MPSLAPLEWAKARAAVLRFCAHHLPCDMVDSLITVSEAVVTLHGAVTRAAAAADAQQRSRTQREEAAPAAGEGLVAMSADDFLPLLTLVLVLANPPDLCVVAELCSQLLDPEEAIAERG
jgi:hypothetical protein